MDDTRHKQFYRDNLPWLEDNLSLKVLLSPLYSAKLITKIGMEGIKCKLDNDGNTIAARCLVMDQLNYRPDIQSLYTFVKVLYENDHQPLVPYFLKKFPELQKDYPDILPINDDDCQEPCTATRFQHAPEVIIQPSTSTVGIQQQPSTSIVAQHSNDIDIQNSTTVGKQEPDFALNPTNSVSEFVFSAGSQTTVSGDGKNMKSRSAAMGQYQKESVPGTRGYACSQKPETQKRKTIDRLDDIKSDRLSNRICQIRYGADNKCTATGFLYDMGHEDNNTYCVIMTSQHILEKLKENTDAYVLFNFQSRGAVPAKYPIVGLVHEYEPLDFMLLALEENDALTEYFKNETGFQKYIHNTDITEIDMLTLIGHPGGLKLQKDRLEVYDPQTVEDDIIRKQGGNALDPKKGGYLEHLQSPHRDNYMFYKCFSLHGSSGSPCFEYLGDGEDDIHIVCIQKGGLYACNNNAQEGDQCDYAIGVKINKIKEHLDQIPKFSIVKF